MYHAVVPDKFDTSGRRIVHHEKFYAREAPLPLVSPREDVEEENLARFLR